MREQARFLEHIAARAPMRRHEHSARRFLPAFAVELDPRRGRAEKSGDGAQHARFAGARWAEKRRHAARRGAKIHVEGEGPERMAQPHGESAHRRRYIA
jgi:hypothetical protein